MSGRQLAIFLVLALSCSPQADESAKSSAEASSALASFRVEDAYFHLERTECYGWCPDYTLEAGSDGTVRFEGRHYVQRLGVHTAEVAPVVIEELAELTLEAGFMDLTQAEVSHCPEMATDSPSATLTVRIDGRENTIEYYYGCRGLEVHAMLVTLLQKVDEAL